jgi:hypothetical protein
MRENRVPQVIDPLCVLPRFEGKHSRIDLLKKIRGQGHKGQKIKNAQAFAPGGTLGDRNV